MWGVIDPGSDRDLMTVIAREIDDDVARVARRNFIHDGEGIVGAAVIDENDFASGVEPIHYAVQARVERGKDCFLAVNRNDKTDFRRFLSHKRSPFRR